MDCVNCVLEIDGFDRDWVEHAAVTDDAVKHFSETYSVPAGSGQRRGRVKPELLATKQQKSIDMI